MLVGMKEERKPGIYTSRWMLCERKIFRDYSSRERYYDYGNGTNQKFINFKLSVTAEKTHIAFQLVLFVRLVVLALYWMLGTHKSY